MKRVRVSSISSESTAPSTKITAVEQQPQHVSVIRCHLPPHAPEDFDNVTEYEEHYYAEHTNRCIECHSNFPAAHLLDLHISEEHDPIIAIKRDAGEKTYGCFIEGCTKVCQDWKKRRNHLVDKHSYPRNYDFFMIRDGIDGRQSLLRAGIDAQGHRKSSRGRDRQNSSASRSTTSSIVGGTQGMPSTGPSSTLDRTEEADIDTQTPHANADVVMQELTTEVSSLRMMPRSTQRKVPRTIQFGYKKQSGFSRR